jgi:hypothetical protein
MWGFVAGGWAGPEQKQTGRGTYLTGCAGRREYSR